MSDHENFYASLVNFCQTQIGNLVASGISDNLAYCDYDSHSQIEELPKTDLIGLANLHWANSGHLFEIAASIGCSTWDDTNLFRHRKILGAVSPLLFPMKELPLLDADTGERIGWMKVDGTTAVMPMTLSTQRSMQFILVGFQTSRTS